MHTIKTVTKPTPHFQFTKQVELNTANFPYPKISLTSKVISGTFKQKISTSLFASERLLSVGTQITIHQGCMSNFDKCRSLERAENTMRKCLHGNNGSHN